MNKPCCKQSIIDKYLEPSKKRKKQIESVISFLRKKYSHAIAEYYKFCLSAGSYYKKSMYEDGKKYFKLELGFYPTLVKDSVIFFDSEQCYKSALRLQEKAEEIEKEIKIMEEE